ncbi:MAG: oxaloacetate decarboxylase alpha subunit [Enterobacterales bacterium]|jgi:oxaloacetate decarboxylase alpha subunit
MEKKKLGITELVLRDAHQSLFATRMRIDDMLPIAEKLDDMGFWSLETWGGATFDSCIRYLGEDPWERMRKLKKAMPKTPHQMLFRAQNILGYRHYADDVVRAFVERAAINGVDVFRIFDAMNDMRNLETAVKAVIKVDKHAQGAMSYTLSPVHNLNTWLEMAMRLEDMGCHSICIKDMAGLLKPYVAFELITKLKESISIPIALHSHATTGLSPATLVKAVEAGVDTIDTAISSMSATYGHSATETMVSIFEETERSTELNLHALEDISVYFKDVRKKYAKWEGSLKGVDSRILISQVPGGMLTNMENQLKEQGAESRMEEVLVEIPKVRKDLGYIPLVTPTSQIVGTQAVLNVLSGERYKNITKETAGVLKGEYGATAAPVNAELQEQILKGEEPISCRPADLLAPELQNLTSELMAIAKDKNIKLAEAEIDDVLTYALFPQIGLKFLENRDNPDAFEPAPSADLPNDQSSVNKQPSEHGHYLVTVEGVDYQVKVSETGAVEHYQASNTDKPTFNQITPTSITTTPLTSPLSGNIFKVLVKEGQKVEEDEVVIILEAMKMETEIRSSVAGTIFKLIVKEGDAVMVADTLLEIG